MNTNVSASTSGDTAGNGFFISSTVKTGTGTKETETVTSRGTSAANSSGSSSGTVQGDSGQGTVIDR